jgi:hypothetical protein
MVSLVLSAFLMTALAHCTLWGWSGKNLRCCAMPRPTAAMSHSQHKNTTKRAVSINEIVGGVCFTKNRKIRFTGNKKVIKRSFFLFAS